MDDDLASTITMTSVTDELSVDETDITSDDLEASLSVMTPDVSEERNEAHAHISQEQLPRKQEESCIQGENDRQTIVTSEKHEPCTRSNLFKQPEQKKAGSAKFNTNSGHGIQFPDLWSAPDRWYEHSCFNRYWQHYQFVSLWCQKQVDVYKAVVHQYNMVSAQQETQRQKKSTRVSGPASSTVKKPISSKTFRNRKARRRRKAAKKRLRMALKNAELAGSCSSLLHSSGEGQQSVPTKIEGETTQSSTEGTGKDEDMELEISDEMLDFFVQSHKHRQERDAQKKKKENGKERRRVNIEEVKAEEKTVTEVAPTERPGCKRTSEMRLLYGKGAAMIHGMETALQMTFDRSLDVNQPRLWPNMPFRIVF